MTKTELKREAQSLKANRLLPLVMEARRNEIYERWAAATEPVLREQQWHALRQLDELAGAIDNAIREPGGSRNSNN